MKVEILEGVLTITPETEAELKDLHMWDISSTMRKAGSTSYCTKTLKIDTSSANIN